MSLKTAKVEHGLVWFGSCNKLLFIDNKFAHQIIGYAYLYVFEYAIND